MKTGRVWIEGVVVIGILVVCLIGSNSVCPGIARGAAAPAEAVHFDTLTEFLPAPPAGWMEDEPKGMMGTHEEGKWSYATVHYAKIGDEGITADVEILDSAFLQVAARITWQGLYAYDGPEGYAKSIYIRGFPAWEIYETNVEEYRLYMNVNERFFLFIRTNGDRNALYEFVDAIDYAGIAELEGVTAPSSESSPPTTSLTNATPEPVAEDREETAGFELVLTIVGLSTAVILLKRRA